MSDGLLTFAARGLLVDLERFAAQPEGGQPDQVATFIARYLDLIRVPQQSCPAPRG